MSKAKNMLELEENTKMKGKLLGKRKLLYKKIKIKEKKQNITPY